MKNIFVLFFMVMLAACGSEKKSGTVAPPSPSPSHKSDAVGPFTVDFSTSPIYYHSLKVPIAEQESGFVDYEIATPEVAVIQFTATLMKVSGCSATQVIHEIYWQPDVSSAVLRRVYRGTSMYTSPGIKGAVVHNLKGLSGCKEIELQTTLTKI